jgi:protein-disulfide isomerase
MSLDTRGSVTANVDVGNAPARGSQDAPVTIVEFSDYECPFCGRFFRETLPALQTEYIDSGRVRLVYRDFPLNSHRHAQKAAEAAKCADGQGHYWAMHDLLFERGVAGGCGISSVTLGS